MSKTAEERRIPSAIVRTSDGESRTTIWTISSANSTNSKEELKNRPYLEKLKLVGALIPCTFDHVSDVLVMIQLLQSHGDFPILFVIALLIDIIPGLCITYQFLLDGYKWKSLTLIFHPINAYLHTFLIVTGFAKLHDGFSRKVVTYSHHVQGLLESPTQAIYTLTLICLGFLKTPASTSHSEENTITNSFGFSIQLSFIPMLSFGISFISFMINTGKAIKILYIWERQKQNQVLSWILLLIATVLFRIQVWVLLCTFLAEYVFGVVLLVLVANFLIFINQSSSIKADPILASFYSLCIPVIIIPDENDLENLLVKSTILKKTYNFLTLAGNFILMIGLTGVATKIQNNELNHSSSVRIRRDVFIPVIISTVVLFLVSGLSTVFLNTKQMTSTKLWEKTNKKTRGYLAIFAKVILMGFLIGAFITPFLVTRQEKKHILEIEDVCGKGFNFKFSALIRGSSKDNDDLQKVNSIHKCKNKMGIINPLGCMGEYMILENTSPASPLVGFLAGAKLILINPNVNIIQDFSRVVQEECVRFTRVVCYYPYFSKNEGFLPEAMKPPPEKPNLCTHIIYAYNILDPQTFTLTHIDKTYDIDEHFFQRVTSLKKVNHTQVLLSVGGPEYDPDNTQFRTLVNDFNISNNFIHHSIAYLKKHNFDGLELFWRNVMELDKDPYQNFITELYTAFRKQGLTLAICVTSLKEFRSSYDVRQLSQIVDFINLFSWDLNGPWGTNARFGNPIEADDETDELTLSNRVEEFIHLGVDKQKLVVGVQVHAQSLKLESSENHEVGAKTIQSDYNRIKYSEVCQLYRDGGWTLREVGKQGTYMFKGTNWTSFNSAKNMQEKARWVEEKGLGGVVLFTIDYDDHKGVCGCGRFPLLSAINGEMGRIEDIHKDCTFYRRK